MKELLEKEINFTTSKKAKENLQKILEYLIDLESIISKYKNMQVMNDKELEIYKSIK